tara:strand:+ start:133 stop:711 length:579 start_codon:yes stop_codon:yes gene_type:complete
MKKKIKNENIEIETAITFLKKGKLILYPTDTVWGIGCDATSSKAIENLYNLKKRDEGKAMICLVNDYQMLKSYIPKISISQLSYLNSKNPTTVIFENSIGISEKALGENKSIAMRIPKHNFCNKLITKFGKPIISTSANISNKQSPLNFHQIENEILDGVDYVVNLEKETITKKTSRIIKIDSFGEISIIRP